MLDGNMDLEKVNDFLGALLQMNPENMYRYKGLLAVDGDDSRLVFQASCLFSVSRHCLKLSLGIHDSLPVGTSGCALCDLWLSVCTLQWSDML